MNDPKEQVWTIAQLTRRIKGLLEQAIGEVWVSGEISNWKVASSGHAYFTLKDEDSQIDAVMFRGALGKLRFEPESGLEVLALGRVSVYERRGNYQIILSEMQPKGVGALQLRFEQLKKKLAAEGLFDEARKKKLPMLPRRIGIVTSPTGAAIRDMLNVLGRRFAGVHVLLYPASVQGAKAAGEIAEGIRALDRHGVDVIIAGRGGGSLEDLWPFNEEVVVRAVAAAQTPIISAVGHEIDFTLCDFAADLRAPTPSAAAELVVKERQALVEGLANLRRRMLGGLGHQVKDARHRLAGLRGSYVFARPDELVRQRRQEFDELRMRLDGGMAERVAALKVRLARAGRALPLLSPAMRLRQARERMLGLQMRLQAGATGKVARTWHRAGNAARSLWLLSPAQRVGELRGRETVARERCERAMRAAVETARAELRMAAAQLDALSPLAILGRGYAIAWKLPEASVVRDAAQLGKGDLLRIRFGKGNAIANVQGLENE